MREESIYFGGDFDEDDLYVGPTLIDSVTWDSPLMKEEVFGPLLPVLTFKTLSSALESIKQQEKPLALYLFTEKKEEKDLVLSSISFGGGCINDTLMHVSNVNLPFGGVGHSGQGAYHGKRSFDLFSHKKSIMDNPTLVDIPLRYPPYDKLKESAIRFFLS